MAAEKKAGQLVNRLLAGASDIRDGEGRGVAVSALLFFLVLMVVMLLRPVREAWGLQAVGIEWVRYLFLVTVVATMALVPAFGVLVSCVSRRVLLAVSYQACAVLLLGFGLAPLFLSQENTGVLYVLYYVFHSVFNLFIVSLFWALMADVYSVTESKRLFPAIAVGGTLGAVAGSKISEVVARDLGILPLFLIAVVCLEAAVWISFAVAKTHAGKTRAGQDTGPDDDARQSEPLGGSPLAGFVTLIKSPYILGIGLFIVFTSLTSTFLYFTELRIVDELGKDGQQKTALFAYINLWTQLATLVAQAFIAGRVMRYVGVGVALAALPLYAAGAFAVLAAVPTFAVYTIVNALHKAVQRGIARPARETLFTVVPREDKYKAKSCLDTFVCRTGDAASAQLERWLAAFGLGVTGLAFAILPMAVVWALLAVVLGAAQSRMAAAQSKS